MDILFHMMVPAMLCMVAGYDRKKALMLAPLGAIPDLDIFFEAHRIYLHSLVLFSALAVPLLFFVRRFRRRYFSTVFLASMYFLSHILLDLFPGSVAILWPLSNVCYGLSFYVTVTQYSVMPTFGLVYRLSEDVTHVPYRVREALMITPESLMVAVLFFAALLYVSFSRKRFKA